MKTTQRTPTSLGLPLVNDVKIECSLCHNQIGASPTNPNFFDGFQDIDFDCFVCNGCKNKYYIDKNMKGNGKLSYSERPVVIETYIAQKAFNSKKKSGTTTPKKKVVKKQKSESTGTIDAFGYKDLTPEQYQDLVEADNSTKKTYTLTELDLQRHVRNNMFAKDGVNELELFINNAKLNDVFYFDFVGHYYEYEDGKPIPVSNIKVHCTYCNNDNHIVGNNYGYFRAYVRHNKSELFYVYCDECAKGFDKFSISDHTTPEKEMLAKDENKTAVTPILEVADANSFSYEEKVKILRKLFINEDVDFLNPEKHRIFPNKYYASFAIKKMPYVCDGCNKPFEGNGTYDSAFFVHHAPKELKVYCCAVCIRKSFSNSFENSNQRLFDFVTQLHGYTNAVLLPEKYNNDRKYKIAYDFIKSSWAYEINKFVPKGFSSIAEARDFLRLSEFSGSSHSVDGGHLETRYLNVKWWKNGEIPIEMKEAATLKLINQILADFEPQLPVEGQVIFKGTKLYKIEAETNPTSAKEALQALEDITTPKRELSAAKTINDSYPGGKSASGNYQFLINQIPPVDCIISGFLGHCAVLKKIKPAKMMVGMDIDKKVIGTWSKSEKDIKLINDSFLNQTSFINPVNFGKTLVFLDPPYLMDTRSSQAKIYDYEFSTPEQHEALLNKAIKFPCYVMITAYENELYDRILTEKRGWRKLFFNVQTQRGRRKETLYLNFPEPEELHDYSFFGSDYRDRHNNKKKIARQIKELEGMPAARRNFILNQVINHFRNV